MLRKTMLALAAAAALGATALAPTSASAWGWRLARWLAWPRTPRVRRPGFCRTDLWRLPGADLGRDAVRTGAALGQSLLLSRSGSRGENGNPGLA